MAVAVGPSASGKTRRDPPVAIDIDSLASQSAVNYPLTIKQGFQFKYKLRSKHNLLAMVCHEKIPRHREEGHFDQGMDDVSAIKHHAGGAVGGGGGAAIRSTNKQDSAIHLASAGDDTSTDSLSRNAAILFPPDIVTPSQVINVNSKKQSKLQYTFVLAETNKSVKFWDSVKCLPNHPRFTTKIAKKVEKICFIPRYSVYAACSDEKSIRFYNPRFELFQTFKTTQHIQFVLYNQALHRLIGVSSHVIMIWAMKATVSRGNLTIDMDFRHTTEISLPSDEWITNAVFDSYNYHLYIIVNSKILVYNCTPTTFPLIDQHLQIAHRQVTCLINYHPYGFTVVGCKDGSIKVLNTANVVVHEFWSQYKAITALAVYPYGPVVVASALDKSVRMYSLRSFKEVYCEDEVIRLISPTTGKVLTTCLPLFEMDKVVDVIYAAKANKMFLLIENGEIWIIGTTVNPCVVLDIWRPDAAGEDICSLCIVEGFKQMTPKANGARSMWGRAAKSEVPYSVLMSGTKNGQILIYNLVGDVVRRQQIHFGRITCIVNDMEQNILVTAGEDKIIHVSRFDPMGTASMFDIRVSIETEQIPRCICVGLRQLCVTYDDSTVHMYAFDVDQETSSQLPNHSRSDDHVDTITAICSIKKLGLFVTSSVDATIKVWDMQNNLVREIQFHDPITSISIANPHGDILIDIENRIDMIHHTLYLPPLYLKVLENLKWDNILLVDPLTMTVEEPIAFDEDFNFKQNFACSHVTDSGGGSTASLSEIDIDLSWLEGKKEIESSFVTMNFAIDTYSEAKIKTRLRLSANRRKELLKESEMAYAVLMEKLAVIRERRRKIMESARKRMEVERLEVERRDNILHEEFEKFQRYQEVLNIEPTYLQKTKWQKDSFFEMANTGTQQIEDEYQPYKFFDEDGSSAIPVAADEPPHPRPIGIDEFQIIEGFEDTLPLYFLSELLPGTPDSMDFEYAIEAMSEESLFEEPSIQQEEVPKHIIEESRRKSIVKLVKLAIAPDGVLPNSTINTTVQTWRDEHPGFIGQLSFAEVVSMMLKKKKNGPKKPVKDLAEELRKKEEFKNKIQEMLKKKKEEERIAQEKEEEARKALEAAGNVTIEVPVEPAHTAAASHVNSRGGRPPQIKQLAPQAKPKEHYPKIIEKGMEYQWFPQEEVFYPQIEKAQNIYIQKKEKKKEEELRKLKIEPTVEVVTPIILEMFKKESSNKYKLEMWGYITWMFEEFGNKDTTLLIRHFCRYLQGNPYLDIDIDETRLRSDIINYLPKFGLSQLELLPTMLIQTLSPVETIKDFALQSLFSMGLFDDLYELFLNKMKEIIQIPNENLKIEATASNKAKSDAKANTPTAKQLALMGSSLTTAMQRTSSINGTPPFLARSNSSIVMQRTNSGAINSNNALEVRNCLMTWLRKALRKSLIRTAKDDETLHKLLELNESGLVDRNKKNIEDKEKEDQEMVAIRAKDMKEQKLLSSMSVASSRMSVGVPPPPKKGGKRQSDGATGGKQKTVVMAGSKKGAKRVSVSVAPPPVKLQKKPTSASSVVGFQRSAVNN
ncbi:UNVERIFIED_CONTAM: hypothetical protein HDU68_010114 [Siphonaria sp. JEL0065]|nr:hypothetical protein HDU68_010114 [Siphonaria sp. JEL0065]